MSDDNPQWDNDRYGISAEEQRRIETRWKSDVDLKLDRLCAFADEYEEYLKLCLDRERGKKKLRDAVIEKTWSGLVWAGIVFLGLTVWTYIKDHLK